MRLFIALPLPLEIKKLLDDIITDFKNHCSDRGVVKWVDAKNIHLTVKFLGDTNERLVDSIKKDVTDIGKKYSAVNCVLNKIGCFPNLNRPRVIWAGIETQTEDLFKIADAIDRAMNRHGFDLETREFKAHLTLGRIKDSRGLDDSRRLDDLTNYIKQYKIADSSFTFNKLCLYKSTLTPHGPIYDCLHEVILSEERFE